MSHYEDQWAQFDFSQFYQSAGFNPFGYLDEGSQKLLEYIKSEAIEYFNKQFNTTQMDDRLYRKRLSQDDRVRVFGFMKARKEHWDKEGFLYENR